MGGRYNLFTPVKGDKQSPWTIDFDCNAMRALRVYRGLKQGDLAQLTGINPWIVCAIEQGRARVTEDEVRRIREALKWDEALDELVASKAAKE